MKALLDGRPYLIQRLGHVANNAGLMPVFQGMLHEDRDFVHMKNAISTELERQGVQDVDDLLMLFEIPDEYDN
jgi:hypothetical protein